MTGNRRMRLVIVMIIVLSMCGNICAANRGNSIPPKVPATTTPQKKREGTSIFSKLRIPEETKMLPWQATVLLRLIKPKFLQEQDEKFLMSSNSREKLLSVQLLSNFYKWIGGNLDKLSDWGIRHRKTFGIAAKAAVFTYIGFALLRRLGNWYKGMAEYEILLDHTDFDHQAYGGCFNGMGSSLIASINQTAVVEYRYSHLMRRLRNSIDAPCFPQTMTDFSLETGRDIAHLLEDIDVRMTDWRRKNNYKKQQNKIHGIHFTQQQQRSHEMSDDSANEAIHSQEKDLMHQRIKESESISVLDDEHELLRGLQCGVSVLQARQTDACLRIARLEVLSAVNTCEDLLYTWRQKVAGKSQAFRLPLPRLLLGKFPGFGRGVSSHTLSGVKSLLGILRGHPSSVKKSVKIDGNSTSEEVIPTSQPLVRTNGTDTEESKVVGEVESGSEGDLSDAGQAGKYKSILRDLNAREKVILLEGLQKGLYEVGGKIQNHLFKLKAIRDKLLKEELIITNHATGFSSTTILHKKSKKHWHEIDEWISEGSRICTHSLSIVMIRNQQSTSTSTSTSVNTQSYNNNNKKNNYDGNNYSDGLDTDDDVLDDENTEYGAKDERERENLHENTYGYSLESVKMTRNVNQNLNSQSINDQSDDINDGENYGYGEVPVSRSEFNEQKQNIRKVAQKFEVPVIVLQFLCFSAAQFDGNFPAVSTNGNVRSDVGTGTLLRTFSLPESLSDIVEKCFLVRDSDAFVDATEAVGDKIKKISSWYEIESSVWGNDKTPNIELRSVAFDSNHDRDPFDGFNGKILNRDDFINSTSNSNHHEETIFNTSAIYQTKNEMTELKFSVPEMNKTEIPPISVEFNGDNLPFPDISEITVKNGNGKMKKNKYLDDVILRNLKKGLHHFVDFFIGNNFQQDIVLDSDIATLPSSTSFVTEISSINTSATNTTSSSTSSLWGRQIKYFHEDGGNLFNSISLSNQSVFQIMKINKKINSFDTGTKNKNENNDVEKSHFSENDLSSDLKNNGSCNTDSIIILGYTDLSHMPYCKNCSYVTRWEFRNTDITENTKISVSEKLGGDQKLKVRKSTSISVFLDIKCPPSIYRSFIVAGIKKELKVIAEKFEVSCRSILEKNENFENFVASDGELKLLNLIGKNHQNYELASNSLDNDDEFRIINFDVPQNEKLSTMTDSEVDETNTKNYEVHTRKEENKKESVDNVHHNLQVNKNYKKKYGEEKSKKNIFENKKTTPLNENIKTHGSVENVIKLEFEDLSPENEIMTKFVVLRDHWRFSSTVMKSLKKCPGAFSDHLALIGLKRKRRTGIFSFLRLRMFFRIFFWGSLSAGAIELSKRSGDIAGATEAAKRNVRDFVQRRITTPTLSIMNDVVLNRRVTILDKEALLDARRSLSVMLYDFLSKHKPKLTEQERRRVIEGLDMRPISEEYEKELRRPIRSILSGQIAKLVLIQLQFVKKELLEAMQAIDELFNANQVNLQLLAVTPAILSLFVVQALSRTIISIAKNSSRGRFVESTGVVHRDLRLAVRNLERLLCMSKEADANAQLLTNTPHTNTLPTHILDSKNANQEFICIMPTAELGILMSILYRIQNILVLNSSHFEELTLRLLQEDLRDVSVAKLTSRQRLAIVERIVRSYSFLQPQRKLFQ